MLGCKHTCCNPCCRVSYLFGLKGPSVSIDTACSSSLVAAHYAAGDILSQHVQASLAAGVSVTLDSLETAAFRITGRQDDDMQQPLV